MDIYQTAVDIFRERLQTDDEQLLKDLAARSELVQVKAAECLGISKSLLQYKLKKYGITGH